MIAADGLLPWLIAAPLLGAALALVVGRYAPLISAAVAAIVTILSFPLLGLVWREGRVSVALGGWPAPLGITLVVDGVSAVLIATTSFVCVAIGVFAAGYLRRREASTPDDDRRWFWPLALLLWAGLNATFMSGDLFNLYVAIELVSLASVSLVALFGGDVVAAVRYLLVTLAGSLLYLLGVALLYADYGVVDIATLALLVGKQPATQAAMVVLTVGLTLKAAIVPLHFWLAPAHAGASSPVSALLSGLVVEAVFYLLMRVWLTVFPAIVAPGLAEALGVLGALSIVWGSAQAIVATRLKLLAAYSTVASLGYLMLGFPLALDHAEGAPAWSGVVLFVVAHAPAKAALFLAAGALAQTFGDDELNRMRGVAAKAPTLAFALGLAGVGLIGLPPSGGFAAKWLLLVAAIAGGRWGYVVVIAGGSLLAAAYVFRVLAKTMREIDEAAPAAVVPAAMRLSTLALALAAVGLGLIAEPVTELISAGGPFARASVEAP
jgi:multicomponent Na+:H+ antiporter subunit D